MRVLIEQLERSLDSELYYLSLFAALTIPDIAGALDSEDGQADGERYKAWYEQWVRPRAQEHVLSQVPPAARAYIGDWENPLTGDACYRFRCSLLHQGSSRHPKSAYSRVLFIKPGATSNTVHLNLINGALCIDVSSFCREVIEGTRLWLAQVEDTARYKTNCGKFARVHPNGLSPYIGGVPVVG